MKRPQSQQEALWSLIKNLSPAEKKIFQKKFKATGFNPLYARLFEWICGHDTPDEKALLKELGPELNKNNLSYTRFYLQAQLLDTLGRLAMKEGGPATLIHNVLLIRKLFQHQQHTMAMRLWKQSLRQARKFEDFTIIRLLRDEYLNFQIYYNSEVSYATLLQVYNEHVVNYEEYVQTIQLEELCYGCVLIYKKSQFGMVSELNERLRKLADHPLLYNTQGTSPFLRFHYWSLANGIVCCLQRNFETAVTYLEPLIAQWHKRPQFILYRPEGYVEVLCNYSAAALRTGRFAELEKLYHNRVNKLIKNECELACFKVLKYQTFLRISQARGNFARVNKLLQKLKPFLMDKDVKLQADIQRPLLMSAAINCFMMDQFHDADAFARQSLALFPDKVAKQYVGATHLFLLLVCYEMKNEWLFQSEFKTCYQFYYRQKSLSGFEKELMGVLKKAYYIKDGEKVVDLLGNSLRRIDKINGKAKQEICSLFNFPGWLSSRVEGHKFREWAREHQQPYSEMY